MGKDLEFESCWKGLRARHLGQKNSRPRVSKVEVMGEVKGDV
jgi:hypothetical protein